MPQIDVIVPTYHEAENLPVLLRRILETFDRAGLDGGVFIVDDDSNDGTEQVVKPFLDAGRVRLHIRRGERGLATAVIEGFRRSQAAILVVCDADLSHPVESIPDLVAPVRSGEVEMTIGSRFVPGGRDEGRSIFRIVTSRVACLLARPLVAAKDPVSGFFCVSREVLARETLDPLGFKIALEILVRCRVKRFREIPIRFVNRERGHSKLGSAQIGAYVVHLMRLADIRHPGTSQFLRFCFVGGLGFLIDFGIFSATLAVLGHEDYLFAQAISFSLAATHNFFWHRHWTFTHGQDRQPALQYISFILVAVAALLVRTFAMAWMVESAGFVIQGAFLLGVILVLLLNFLGSRYLVFHRKPA